MHENEVSGQVVDAAMKVHSALGPGLLEGIYRICLVHDLRLRGLRVDVEVPLPVRYRDLRVDAGYRVDLLVEDVVLVELKALVKILPVHEAQVLSYLKMSGRRIGLLINFNVVHLRTGIRRLIHGY